MVVDREVVVDGSLAVASRSDSALSLTRLTVSVICLESTPASIARTSVSKECNS